MSDYLIRIVDGLPPETNGLFSRMGYIAVCGHAAGPDREDCAARADAQRAAREPRYRADRTMREVQAESVAYAASAALGLDTSDYSFGYVASWAVGKSDDEMRRCMQVVRDAAKEMLEELRAAMAA